jgi:hypothetical protein
MPLRQCPKCKEKSVVVKVYQEVKRMEYCINKGCGYIQDLPKLKVEYAKDGMC